MTPEPTGLRGVCGFMIRPIEGVRQFGVWVCRIPISMGLPLETHMAYPRTCTSYTHRKTWRHTRMRTPSPGTTAARLALPVWPDALSAGVKRWIVGHADHRYRYKSVRYSQLPSRHAAVGDYLCNTIHKLPLVRPEREANQPSPLRELRDLGAPDPRDVKEVGTLCE